MIGKTEGHEACLAALLDACSYPCSQAAFARRCGVTTQTVNQVVLGGRLIPASIAEAIGFERVTVYRRRK
jgi:DNA-binding transcriptional regulator YdaS (Cro superfamily)